MIEWGTGANKVQVECLTRKPSQRIEVRLSGRRKTPNLPDVVTLEEPAAEEFADLRTAAIEADAKMDVEFPEPPRPPDTVAGESDYDRTVRMAKFLRELSDREDARHAYRTNLEHAPYAKIMVDAVNMLTDYTVAVSDLVPECFKAQPIAGLLEVWETPLGGPVSPVETPAPTPVIPSVDVAPSTDQPSDQPEAASPEPSPSSRPGGKPSPPSPPPSSTA